MKARVAKRHNRKLSPSNSNAETWYYGKSCKQWKESPFRVSNDVGKGAYCLEKLDDKKVPHTWNATSLQMYYN
ncbi:hypothetical protein CR513_29952, partial [Mucuna pruriens]